MLLLHGEAWPHSIYNHKHAYNFPLQIVLVAAVWLNNTNKYIIKNVETIRYLYPIGVKFVGMQAYHLSSVCHLCKVSCLLEYTNLCMYALKYIIVIIISSSGDFLVYLQINNIERCNTH